MLTAALATGREEIVLAAGRVTQAILRGRALKQFGKELEELHKKGKLREDYADSKYGFRSLVDLLTAIDEEASDDDRLRTAKAMFIAVNSPGVSEGEALVRYQLFRIALKLSGSQLLILSLCHSLHKRRVFTPSVAPTAQNWLNQIAMGLGHQVFSLIELDEEVLIQHGIITKRLHGDRSGVTPDNARLSDLGLKLCSLIENYSGDIPAAG